MKPKRIFIVRHGQSKGNVNREVYKDTPDYAVELTDVGNGEAVGVGQNMSNIIENESVQFYVSPFWRTRQTYRGIRQSFPRYLKNHGIYKYYEDPRLREQEWAGKFPPKGFDMIMERERDAYGHFYYRFKGGESCADVFDRVGGFLNTLFRDFEKDDFPENCIIVTHGMAMRLLLMRWFHVSVEQFELWRNPKNCEYFLLELQEDGKYKLVTPLRTYAKRTHNFQFDYKGEEYLFPVAHSLPYMANKEKEVENQQKELTLWNKSV
jgi:broad specificity phosphatase PhoE